MNKELEGAVVIGVIGFAIWECHEAYCKQAPTLMALRNADADDTTMRQALMDADVGIGGMAILGGFAVSVLLKSWLPFFLVAAAFVWVSWIHHNTLQGPTIATIDSLGASRNDNYTTRPTL